MLGLSFSAIAKGAEARDIYDRYLEWQLTPGRVQTGETDGATRLYEQAEAQRLSGRSMWVAVAAVYGAQVIVGVLAERRFQRRIESVSGFGESADTTGAARLSIAPMALPNGRGIGLRFSW
jgi:hypothetical protein